VQWELAYFQNLQLIAQSCKDPLKWWKTNEVQFPIVGFLACQILGTMGSQIEA
jgi:hypothetical protein